MVPHCGVRYYSVQVCGLLYELLAQITFLSIQLGNAAYYDSLKEVESSRDVYALL